MTELSEILRLNAEKYPKMQPCDAVKLIFQNEFGSGHFIADEKGAFEWLCREFESCSKLNMPLFESIGNGIVRVNLQALNTEEYPLEKLFANFLDCSKSHSGNMDSFLKKLDVLQELTKQGIFGFDENELCRYLEEYKKSGCPAVSHSEIYRETYHPAYRIINRL